MTFQPVVPFGGYAGWQFLQNTLEKQQTAFEASPQIERSSEAFRERIGSIDTAEQLVNDRELLEVALGAFGLEDDINNKYFIQSVLEEGTTEDTALANRLSDARYYEFAQAFGFGDFSIPNTVLSDFPDQIVDRFETKSFEVAVGEVNADMRLALGLSDALDGVLNAASTNDARWFSIMGNAPLRSVFEAALGLPTSIGAIDLDQQLEAFKSRAQSVFGTDDVGELTTQEKKDDINRLFLLRASIEDTSFVTGASAALALLQQVS